jgi:hypothetical protein
MEQIKFDAKGPALSVNMKYESNHAENLFVTYTYTLWEAQSSAIVDERSGNNFNNDDDNYRLTTPSAKNIGRVIDVLSMLKNAGTEDLEARVKIEICQGGEPLETITETKTVAGDSTVINQIFIKLSV